MAYYHNSTFEIKPGAKRLRAKKQIKRGGKLRPGTASAKKPIYGPRSGKVRRVCKQCRKPFTAWRSDVGKACSRVCADLLRRTRVTRTCKECGAEFKIHPSQFKYYKGAGQFCSKPCHAAYKVKTTADKPTRDRYGRTSRQADKEWQKTVRERDGYTCQRCGKYERYIHTHHVAPRSRRPDLKHDPNNGKCLCGSCHQWVHHHPRQAATLGLLSDASYERAQKQKAVCRICGSRHFGLGYCNKHWRRFKKYGDPFLTGQRGHPELPPIRVND